ncbi:alpha/beta hydrolase [Thermosipho atlanticus]|uniref:Lysophospholipase, alpha-beta hydrolase superfamily n=1 Tax=Thermosipho atlanticus DSM 15807 TaxID=1123380 RepID=A0A1M5RUV7_9BACT|nr:alpha/beta hydrolase [Thermosipho atlanticus]SHH30097.1 Lysophospholipase, alpha-beta hydrolase superfamily [Thermosipho atlanticus DSM 15807]
MIYQFRKGSGKKGWIVVVHGLGEHIGRYEKLVEGLIKREFGVIGFDLPGHGKSQGRRGHTSIEEIIKVINNLTNDIEKFHIFGHSLGGLIAIRYVQENVDRVKTLVVSSPALYIKPSILQKVLLSIMIYFYPSLTVSNGIDPNLLSRNKEAVEKYVKDKLVHDRISVKLGRSLVKNIQLAHSRVNDIVVPTLMLVGTEDKITPLDGSYAFFERLQLPKEDKLLIKYEGGYHEMFEDPKYREKFYNDIFEWYENRWR